MRQKYLILLSLAGAVLCLDQLTKFWILDLYSLGETQPIIEGIFNITHVRNPGAAFGFLAIPSNAAAVALP